MRFHVITLFPDAFSSYLGESILKRAIEDKKIKVLFYNPRDFADNKHDRVDRRPYGGGPGMVIQALPVIKAVEAALRDSGFKIQDSRIKKISAKAKKLPATSYQLPKLPPIIWLTPSGKQFTNEMARGFVKKATDMILVCGRYEGIDARVKKAYKVKEISVGPFVLTGGELPTMMMIDVIARQVEGVLGDFNSLEEERTASPDVYTRPEIFVHNGKKYRVPKILLSGHQAKIEEWKSKQKQK